MREPEIIMQRLGDDPLTELMELDSIYGWSKRINTLSSLFRKKKRSRAPFFFLLSLLIIGSLALGFGLAMVYLTLA